MPQGSGQAKVVWKSRSHKGQILVDNHSIFINIWNQISVSCIIHFQWLFQYNLRHRLYTYWPFEALAFTLTFTTDQYICVTFTTPSHPWKITNTHQIDIRIIYHYNSEISSVPFCKMYFGFNQAVFQPWSRQA